MKTVGIISRKGGVGKSTVAIHLAELAARSGQRVALLDLDLQETCVGWRKKRVSDSVVVVRSSVEQLREHLDLLKRGGAEWVFIDTMPDIDSTAKAVAMASDFVVIPTRPSVVDIESIAGTVGLVRRLGAPSGVVFNLVPSRGKEIRGARRAMDSLQQPYAPTSMIDRVAYRRAVGTGKVAGDIDSKAASEVQGVWKYVQERIVEVAA